jgi:hypothetical protein
VTANQDITSDGGFVDYTVTVTNNDAGGCAVQTFDLKLFNDTNAVDFAAATFPSGSTTANIGPGGSDSSVVVRVTANAGTLNAATKSIDISTDGASDPNHADSNVLTRTTTMNVLCTTAPAVSITTASGDITTEGGNRVYTIQVDNNNAVACGSGDFDLALVDDNGAAFTTPSVFAADPLTVNSGGGSNTTTITVTAQAGAANGQVNNTYFYTGVNGTIPQSANSNVVATTINRPCVRNPATFTHSVNKNIAPDGTGVYTLTVINNDVDCADTTFSFGIDSEVESNVGTFTLPSTFTAPSVTVAAGATDSSVDFTVVGNGTGLELDTLTSTVRLSDAANHAGQDQTTAPVTTIKPFDPLIHSSLSTASTKHAADGGWGVAGARYGEFNCQLCHTPVTTNIKRIRETLPNAPDISKGDFPGAGGVILFTDATEPTTDFGDDSTAPRASSNRICEVCHTYDATKAAGVDKHAYNQGVDSGHENAKDCMACHKHNSGFKAAGTCDACHGYPPQPGDASVTPARTDDGKAYLAVEGKGAHAEHVNHLAALAGVVLDPNTDGYGDLNVTAVCGVCHDMNGATHEMSGGTRLINFNGSNAFQFGASAPAYNGVQGDPSATTPKTCSNINCHYQASPWWE